MGPSKITIHFKGGNILRGNTNDLFPNKKTFHLNLEDSLVKEINVEELRAAFFVKDFKGDNNYIYEYNDDVSGGGKNALLYWI